jgi:hypothetical protein
MRPSALALVLLVAALAGCGGSPPEAPASIFGVWEGEGAQWNDGDRSREPDDRWPLRITVTRSETGVPEAGIEYPSFPCGGNLEYVGPSTEPGALPGDAVFRERITYGSDNCFTGGTVLLRPEPGALVFAWAIDSSPTTASARLEPAE